MMLEENINAIFDAAEKVIEDKTGQTFVEVSIPRKECIRVKMVELIDGGYHGAREASHDFSYNAGDDCDNIVHFWMGALAGFKERMK